MRPCVTSLVRFSFLVLICVFAGSAPAQIRSGARSGPNQSASAAPYSETHAAVELDLCVRVGTNPDQCPQNPIDFGAYVPVITYTYGQILDGVARFPQTPADGYATISANGVVVCTLYESMPEVACPADSTNFDPGKYTLILLYTNPDDGTTMAGAPVVVTVLQDATAKFTVTSSMNPAPVGTAVTFTAAAAGTYGEPATGQVAFSVDGASGPTRALDATGTAQFTTSALALGTHTITASYPGSIDLAAPPDATLTQVIVPPMTSTTLTSSLNPSPFGQNVTFTASVAAADPALHPFGAVSFNDGSTTLSTRRVSSQGDASTSISTLTSGTHNITANYLGDAATGPSSAALAQQVDFPLTEATPGFLVTVTPSPVVLGVGLTADLAVTVTPRSGFSQPVTLTCDDLPHESTCTFGESVIPPGGGSTKLDLHVASPHDCGSNSPYFYGANRSGPGLIRYGGPALAGLLMALLPRRRRRRKGLLAFSACIGLAGLIGCSSTCTDFGTYPGSYTFKVIGTAPSATNGTSGGSGTPLAVPVSVALTVKI